MLEKAVRAAGGKVKLVKMNIDEHPQIAGQLGVQSIPAVFAFQRRPAGRRLHGRAAGKPDQGLHRAPVGPLGPSAAEELLARGRRRSRPRATPAARPSSMPPSWRRTRRTSRRSPAWRSSIWNSAISTAPSASSPWRRRPRQNDPAIAGARAALELAEQAGIARRPRRICSARVAADPARPPGALRSRAWRSMPRTARGGGRPAPRDRAPRPQLERGRRAQAARPVLRGLGPDGRDDARGPAALLDPVLVTPSSQREIGMGMNAVYRGPQDLPRGDPGLPAAGRAAAAARPAAAQHLRAALSRHGRRRADGRPPHRHDPAGRRRRRLAPLVPRLYQVGCAGRITAVRRDRRRPLSHHPDRASRASASRRSWRPTTPYRQCRVDFEPFAADFIAARRRGRGRPRRRRQGLARLRRGRPMCRSTGTASRRRPTRRWSTRWA